VEISQETLETQQDQQVTERFTRAIDQLGQTDDKGRKKLEIRLGGIYALERIAWDSPGRDYSTVIEVLTAYVRANAPYSPKASPDTGAVPNKQSEQEENGEQDKDVEQEAQHSPKEPSADIQAILDVLGRREEDRVPKEYRVRLDLRRTDLEEADLTGAHLTLANLTLANLTGANLRGADLGKEQLERAIGDEATKLSEGFTRPASWTTGTDEQADGDE
jgi:hypothetical protein